MSWYKVVLSDQDLAAGKGMALQDAFAVVFMAHGGPPDAGMFGGLDITSHDYFFSPGAAQIARSVIEGYAGVKCEAPRRSEIAYLVSVSGAEAVPFAPER